MSRTGKNPIPVPDGVDVKVDGARIEVKGKLGSMERTVNPGIQVELDEAGKAICVKRTGDTRELRALHGLNRSLIANMVHGVSEGFSKSMEVIGTGYQVALQGNKLALRVGYSHPVEMEIPEGMSVEVATPSNPGRFVIKGYDKQVLGQFAADVRAVRPPEPYKGKGIKYADEVVRRKAGKALVGAGT